MPFCFTFMWPCVVPNFFIIKPTRCTNFSNLLLHETLHVSGSSSAHHQEFIHCTLGTGVCHTDLKTAGPSWSCSKAVFKSVWDTPVPSVQWINSWWWAEELSETCRVSCRNIFEKLVHLVGFIIKKSHTLFLHLPSYLFCRVFWLKLFKHFSYLLCVLIVPWLDHPKKI